MAGQVLLVPLDFVIRTQYVHAASTLCKLLDLGVVPVVNENDAVADDEIRWGDNDRLAALVANLVQADLLVLLTDTAGVLTEDPRRNADASLIAEIVEFDRHLTSLAGGAGSDRGSGGMASKLTAARVASLSGVTTVIADAKRQGVLADAAAGTAGVGTLVRASAQRMPARKLWIGFAVGSAGEITVDSGARAALERGKSLLAIGVRSVSRRIRRRRRSGGTRSGRRRVREGPRPPQQRRSAQRRRPLPRGPSAGRAPHRRPRQRPGGPRSALTLRELLAAVGGDAQLLAQLGEPGLGLLVAGRGLDLQHPALGALALGQLGSPFGLGVAGLDLVADLGEGGHILTDRPPTAC